MFKSKRLVCMLGVTAVLLALLLGGGYYIKNTYTVKNVYVEGNVHYTKEEIQAIVMDGVLGDNSLYLSMKYKNRGIDNVPFVDVMDVTVLAPDTIRITVYEKVLTGYVKYLGTYMYFDKDGYVVESSAEKTAGVPQVTGLSFDHLVVGEPLPVENPQVFQNILNVTKLLKKYELASEKIHFGKSEEVTVYFGEIKVSLGKEEGYLEDKLMLLPELLPSLEGKTGVLQMEAYDANGGKYTFKPDAG